MSSMKRTSLVLIALVSSIVLVTVGCTPAAPAQAPASPGAPTAAPKPTEDAALKGLTDAQLKWAQAAQLGPFAPKTQDWAAIEAAAKKEGKVVVYSNSSRVADFAKSFEAAYPGIKVEGYDISTVDLIAKLQKEQKAEIYNADVVLVGDVPTVYNEMFNPPTKMLWNFVPQELEALIDPAAREPLLMHRYGLDVFAYNTEVFKEPPVKNIWDFTKPEWKGRIVLPDPQKVALCQVFLTIATQKSDEMAKAYEAAFGKPITLDAGVPNAGYQWIKDVLKNEPALTSSSGDAATAIGALGQKNPPIGLTTYSKIRNAQKGEIAFDVMWGMTPVIGFVEETALEIANQAPHPNAAKLMIRWMLGDEKGGNGFTPFYVPGDYSTRKDVPPPPGAKPWSEVQKLVWTADRTYIYKNSLQVRDFWLANLKK